MSEDKKYHVFMFCYSWFANGQHGLGHKTLFNENKELRNSDLNDAISFIQEQVQKNNNHNKESVSIVFSNIIHLNYCTQAEFYQEETASN
ncbi:MAG: hypothetical protein RSE18_01085 [Acinetobacter sp.]